jgi:hypothetical protein
MVRWIQVGHDDLLLVRKECRESAISPVRRLSTRVKQGNSLVFGMCYRPPDGERSQAEITGI